jgi:hypothetical protein
MKIVTAISVLAAVSASASVAVSVQCPLPTVYKRKGSGVLATPETFRTVPHNFSHVLYVHKPLVYALYTNNNGKTGFGTIHHFSSRLKRTRNDPL